MQANDFGSLETADRSSAQPTKQPRPGMFAGSSRLDSWDELECGDEVFYIGDHLDAYWLDRPLTFKHDYANASQVRVSDFAHGPHDLSAPDYPASDFVRMEALR